MPLRATRAAPDKLQHDSLLLEQQQGHPAGTTTETCVL